MGGSSSKRKSEIVISGKDHGLHGPAIKVEIESPESDEVQDPTQGIHLLAEKLIYDALKDKKTTKQFGEFLQHVFTDEASLSVTRSLLFWSLNTKDCYGNIKSLSAWQLTNYFKSYGIKDVSNAAQAWILAIPSRETVITPLLTWTLSQKEYVVDPLALVIQDSLPYCKDAVKEGLKYAITENLKSDSIKTVVRDALLGHISRIGSSRSHSSTESTAAEAALLAGEAAAATVQLPAATIVAEKERKQP